VLLKASRAKEVLEIGAAIGYSAISMAECGCNVTTIEKDEGMLKLLTRHIQLAGLEQKITVCPGDASQLLPKLEGTFDFIFVDAAKAHYLEYLPHCLRLLRQGGILFSDNVLFKGRVATDELFIRRKITIIRRLRNYLNELCSREDLDTAIVPIGDGAAISYKKELV
jgi:predicted O-methyltransferase YrrM